MAPPKRKRASDIVNQQGQGQNQTNEVSRDANPAPEAAAAAYGDPVAEVAEVTAPQPADCPFSVEYRSTTKKGTTAGPPKGKKAKRQKIGGVTSGTPTAPPTQELDQTPPEDSTVYTIKPKKDWDALKKYRNFVVGTENFALNEYIFVNHSNIPHGTDIGVQDDTKFWVARVLEIRAIDEAHVYLRVYWLYWPEELPGGRQPYHGQKELIASNHMEIVDAMTVSGRANVKHWLELDEDEELPDLFWRQKFDFPTQTLMEVREHCKCHRYYNPDKLMFGCPHCKTWLHEECLIEEIKQKAYARLVYPGPHVDDETEFKPDTEEADAPVEAPTEVTPAKGKRARKSLLTETVASASNSTPAPGPTSASTLNGKSAPAPGTPGKNKGKGKKTAAIIKEESEKMFDVSLRPNPHGPTKAIVRDLRGNSDYKDKPTWEEEVHCLLCNDIVS